jgi:hypothetical protein
MFAKKPPPFPLAFKQIHIAQTAKDTFQYSYMLDKEAGTQTDLTRDQLLALVKKHLGIE